MTTMKEKALEAFSKLGFTLKEEDEVGYSFEYEGLTYLFMYNDSDEEFFNIALPGIYDANEGNVMRACALMQDLNNTVKYVKAYVLGERVWLFYERELLSGDDMEELIRRMVLHLEAAFVYFQKALRKIDAMVEGDGEEDNGEDDAHGAD